MIKAKESFSIIPQEVAGCLDVTPTSKILYAYLNRIHTLKKAPRYIEHGIISVSLRDLAKEVSMSVNTVTDALSNLNRCNCLLYESDSGRTMFINLNYVGCERGFIKVPDSIMTLSLLPRQKFVLSLIKSFGDKCHANLSTIGLRGGMKNKQVAKTRLTLITKGFLRKELRSKCKRRSFNYIVNLGEYDGKTTTSGPVDGGAKAHIPEVKSEHRIETESACIKKSKSAVLKTAPAVYQKEEVSCIKNSSISVSKTAPLYNKDIKHTLEEKTLSKIYERVSGASSSIDVSELYFICEHKFQKHFSSSFGTQSEFSSMFYNCGLGHECYENFSNLLDFVFCNWDVIKDALKIRFRLPNAKFFNSASWYNSMVDIKEKGIDSLKSKTDRRERGSTDMTKGDESWI